MAKLSIYVDPACPWAWRTALWVRELQAVHPLDVEWKLFSLTEVHRSPEVAAADQPPTDPTLRVLVQARRHGGNEALKSLYFALSRARHERRDNIKSESVIAAALEEVGLPGALLQQALDDATTESDVLGEHSDAVERLGAFGVPWLVLDERSFGLFGPVITEVPQAEAALELWEHTSWFLTQPHFYELKRERP